MIATKFLAALLPTLLSSFTPTSLASPTPNIHLPERQVHVTAPATATIVSYFVAPSCNSPFSNAVQTIASNVCMDLGEGDTTRSIALYSLAVENKVVIPTCVARVWEDERCGDEEYIEVSLGLDEPVADETCVPTPSWSDGSTAMGSVMLLCTY